MYWDKLDNSDNFSLKKVTLDTISNNQSQKNFDVIHFAIYEKPRKLKKSSFF